MRFLTIICLALMFSLAVAVTEKEIISSGKFYYGECTSDDESEAREKAMQRLSENISVTISSDFEDYLQESNGEVEAKTRSIINSYSNITLRNLQPLKKIKGAEYYYMFYIHHDSLQVLYDERKNMICDIYNNAERMCLENNISGALQYYYYSIVLMNSIPESIIAYKNENLRTIIPAKIKKILSGITFTLIKDEKDEETRLLIFEVVYNGKPVSQLEFTYLERNSEFSTVVRDGKAVCKLTGPSIDYKELDIKLEYKFSKEKDIIREVDQLWNVVLRPGFEESKRTLSLSKATPEKITTDKKTKDTKTQGFTFKCNDLQPCPLADKIYEETARFLKILNDADPGKINTAFSNDSFLKEKLTSLMEYNSPEVISNSIQVTVNPVAEGWELRRIPVYCRYKTLNKQSTEYLVLDFNDEGKLQDVNFSIYNQLYEQIVDSKMIEREKEEKLIIIKFLEKYRTAYLDRDMKVLERIFADQAVIIVGRELETKNATAKYQYSKLDESQPDIEYLKMNKEEYLNRQRRIFNNQQDIHLVFNTLDISRKNNDCSVYGIAMRQMYNSTGYSDEGHLFLLVDFEGNEPLIYVRSWQPQEWSREQILQMANFKLLGE